MLRSTSPNRRRREGTWALALLAPLVALIGCIVDHPCDANQVELKSDFSGCVCVEGAVLNADKSACVLCGDNEEVKEGACACKTGFARPSPTAACAASQQGAPCSASAPCNGADFPYCSPQGYCTKSGCTTDAECSVGTYLCETTASPTYCSPPPAPKTCTTSADCTGGAADYCAMGNCVVSGCKATTTCRGMTACCDFSQFGLTDFCIPSASLQGGKCPGTMADPVTR
jgi:hypothetical protein